MIIKPNGNLVVRDPISMQPLSQAGEEKPRNSYWLKRIKDGDVIIVESKTKKGATK